MRKSVLILTAVFFMVLTSFSTGDGDDNMTTNETTLSFHQYANKLYIGIDDEAINQEALNIALKGYFSLLLNNELENKRYLAVADMSLSANTKRFFIIDMETQRLVYKSLVAHGRNSGEEFATNFSNKNRSYQTSIGFYKTGETYDGKRGFSMKLDGLEFSNSNARDRGVIIHGADYVSEKFIKDNVRLGRSLGCPALPMDSFRNAITMLKEGSCLFIYYPQKYYLSKSKLANADIDHLLTSCGTFAGIE